MTVRVMVSDHAFRDVQWEREVAERFGAEFAEWSCASEGETIEALRGAHVALVNLAPVTRAVLGVLATGASVIRYGVGYDNVDVAAARELGVQVANVPDYGADTVADHATACLLALLRKLGGYDRAVRERGWCAAKDLGSLPAFASTTVGLVGLGNIGQAVRERLRAFGFRVLGCDPYADRDAMAGRGIELVDLPDLLAQAHAVSLHAPATEETHHLLGAETIGLMRRGAVVVNTSRGNLVDTAALADALADRRLGGAALDVFEPEPLPADSPLRTLPNVILTPHAAFYSDDSAVNLQRLAAEEAARALAGEPLRCPVA